MSALGLIKKPTFYGLFWTQFIGAFTDNVFKQALVVLVMSRVLHMQGWDGEQLNYLANGLFMAPCFLFSATAGQLADRHTKARLIRMLKALEVFFSGLAMVGFGLKSVPLLMVVLVFFGVQTTLFGPLKYGILPQLLNDKELVGGNATVETATNISILLGTLVGVKVSVFDPLAVGALLVMISTLGYLASRLIPNTPEGDPSLRVEWNPITPTIKTLKLLGEVRSVKNSVLGISWFWLLGLILLETLPVYTFDVLSATPDVYMILLALFSIGVGIGSILCDRLSFGRVEMGLVPLGSLGISVFCFDLFMTGKPWASTVVPITLGEFLHRFGGLRICFDLLMLSVFSGIFIVPLYCIIQQRTRPAIRSQIIAANNIVNALFMVLGTLVLALLRHLGLTLPQIMGVLALANAVVAIYIYTLVREFFLRLIAYLLAHVFYRMKVSGEDFVPKEGGAILVCNHVSFADWLLVMAAIKRPIHFVMWYTYFDMPVVSWLFRDAGVIPISSGRLKPDILAQAFVSIHEVLERGELVCIFPEGSLTKDGVIAPFRPGVDKMVADYPVPVIPMALRGLWGSNFSRSRGGFWKRFATRPLRSKIEVLVGPPIPAAEVNAALLQERVQELRSDQV
jgi:1-acyl-sn-glycerol-3-phosphate acyltransferase